MVEQLICNQQVKGSSPFVSSLPKNERLWRNQQPRARRHAGSVVSGTVMTAGHGGVPEWTKGADCKSAGGSLRRFESFPHHFVGRAGVAQLVEHQPSKLRVAGSSPVARSEDCSRSSVGRARPW